VKGEEKALILFYMRGPSWREEGEGRKNCLRILPALDEEGKGKNLLLRLDKGRR